MNNILSALSNETRLKIIVCLSKGDKSVSELINNCQLSQSAVSQHLQKLKMVKLVTTQKKGRIVNYHLKNLETANIAGKLVNYLKSK